MTSPAPRGRPREAATDRAILQAALDLFIERGVEGASIEQIAKNAGVGKPTIYRRWSGKEELIAAAMESLVADEVGWASGPEIEIASPYELVEAAIEGAAVTTTTPFYRALVARVSARPSATPNSWPCTGNAISARAASWPGACWSGRVRRGPWQLMPTWTLRST